MILAYFKHFKNFLYFFEKSIDLYVRICYYNYRKRGDNIA
nr:MAG TPA: hypothetical protein [Caudoviricetes sp.]